MTPPRRPWLLEFSAIEYLTPFVIGYACVVMVIAYSARGASGFGAAAALPLLALAIPLKVLVPAWTLIAAAAGSALIGPDRHKIAWRELLRLVPGTLAGVAAGLAVFTALSQEALAKWVGAFILCYGLYSLWGTFGGGAKAHIPPRIAAALGGVAGGMTGTIVGTMGSIFFAVYFDVVRLGKEQYRATMTAILLVLTLVRGAGYFAVGEFDREVLLVALLLLAPMFAGLFIGNRFHVGMGETAFRRTVAGALIASGTALLIK